MSTLPDRLADGSLLLHIGPHKTGTSAIQSALAGADELLAAHGVTYFGRRWQREQAPLAATHRPARVGVRQPRPRDWRRLVEDVAAAGEARLVLSSERYCWADADLAASIVDELGGSRVHVVITLRSLERILPSQWQMTVQSGLTMTYDEWLQRVLGEEPTHEAATFWERHAHGELVERWAAAAGVSNVTVIVVDETSRTMLLDVFGALLGVPPGALTAEISNRSLTAGEIELIRRLNVELAGRGWEPEVQVAVVRSGVAAALRESSVPAGETKIVTPRWAAERAAAQADRAISSIRDSGVQVVGDLDWLSVTVPASDSAPVEATAVALPSSVTAVVSAIMRSERLTWQDGVPSRRPRGTPPDRSQGSADVQPVVAGDRPSNRQLDSVAVGALAASLRRRAMRRLRRTG